MKHDPLETSKRKIDRAEKHLTELCLKIGELSNADPYHSVVEPHPDKPGHEIHKVKLSDNIDGPLQEIADLAAEVAIALRSSFDNAGYAIALARDKPNSKHAAFPFAPKLQDISGSLGKSRDLPEEIKSLFCGFQSYQGGNDLLWAVNEVANSDKHRITSAVVNTVVRRKAALGGTRFFEMPLKHIWDTTKNEMVLVTLGPGTEDQFNYEFHFEFFVAFNEIEVIKGKEVVPTLHAMGGVVQSVLMAIEAECRRLKIF